MTANAKNHSGKVNRNGNIYSFGPSGDQLARVNMIRISEYAADAKPKRQKTAFIRVMAGESNSPPESASPISRLGAIQAMHSF